MHLWQKLAILKIALYVGIAFLVSWVKISQEFAFGGGVSDDFLGHVSHVTNIFLWTNDQKSLMTSWKGRGKRSHVSKHIIIYGEIRNLILKTNYAFFVAIMFYDESTFSIPLSFSIYISRFCIICHRMSFNQPYTRKYVMLIVH